MARLSSQVQLHTYRPTDDVDSLDAIRSLGIQIYAAPSRSDIAFSYFHPLSRPAIAPELSSIIAEPPLRLESEAVLRFGFMEGDAIVSADRAVYDPQTVRWQLFSANGSRASDLALVLNELELLSNTNSADAQTALRELFVREGAAVIVVKCGARGAYVYEAGGRKTWISAYESPRVFKIGSGDVFSAAFAYYWGEVQMDPVQAADLASRSVANYVATRHLPLLARNELTALEPIGSDQLRPVQIAGSPATLAGRWLLEEARWCLRQLGLQVYAPDLDSALPTPAEKPAAILVLADFSDSAMELDLEAIISSVRTIWLTETGLMPKSVNQSHIAVADDFATAMYRTAWAASV